MPISSGASCARPSSVGCLDHQTTLTRKKSIGDRRSDQRKRPSTAIPSSGAGRTESKMLTSKVRSPRSPPGFMQPLEKDRIQNGQCKRNRTNNVTAKTNNQNESSLGSSRSAGMFSSRVNSSRVSSSRVPSARSSLEGDSGAPSAIGGNRRRPSCRDVNKTEPNGIREIKKQRTEDKIGTHANSSMHAASGGQKRIDGVRNSDDQRIQSCKPPVLCNGHRRGNPKFMSQMSTGNSSLSRRSFSQRIPDDARLSNIRCNSEETSCAERGRQVCGIGNAGIPKNPVRKHGVPDDGLEKVFKGETGIGKRNDLLVSEVTRASGRRETDSLILNSLMSNTSDKQNANPAKAKNYAANCNAMKIALRGPPSPVKVPPTYNDFLASNGMQEHEDACMQTTTADDLIDIIDREVDAEYHLQPNSINPKARSFPGSCLSMQLSTMSNLYDSSVVHNRNGGDKWERDDSEQSCETTRILNGEEKRNSQTAPGRDFRIENKNFANIPCGINDNIYDNSYYCQGMNSAHRPLCMSDMSGSQMDYSPLLNRNKTSTVPPIDPSYRKESDGCCQDKNSKEDKRDGIKKEVEIDNDEFQSPNEHLTIQNWTSQYPNETPFPESNLEFKTCWRDPQTAYRKLIEQNKNDEDKIETLNKNRVSIIPEVEDNDLLNQIDCTMKISDDSGSEQNNSGDKYSVLATRKRTDLLEGACFKGKPVNQYPNNNKKYEDIIIDDNIEQSRFKNSKKDYDYPQHVSAYPFSATPNRRDRRSVLVSPLPDEFDLESSSRDVYTLTNPRPRVSPKPDRYELKKDKETFGSIVYVAYKSNSAASKRSKSNPVTIGKRSMRDGRCRISRGEDVLGIYNTSSELASAITCDEEMRNLVSTCGIQGGTQIIQQLLQVDRSGNRRLATRQRQASEFQDKETCFGNDLDVVDRIRSGSMKDYRRASACLSPAQAKYAFQDIQGFKRQSAEDIVVAKKTDRPSPSGSEESPDLHADLHAVAGSQPIDAYSGDIDNEKANSKSHDSLDKDKGKDDYDDRDKDDMQRGRDQKKDSVVEQPVRQLSFIEQMTESSTKNSELRNYIVTKVSDEIEKSDLKISSEKLPAKPFVKRHSMLKRANSCHSGSRPDRSVGASSDSERVLFSQTILEDNSFGIVNAVERTIEDVSFKSNEENIFSSYHKACTPQKTTKPRPAHWTAVQNPEALKEATTPIDVSVHQTMGRLQKARADLPRTPFQTTETNKTPGFFYPSPLASGLASCPRAGSIVRASGYRLRKPTEEDDGVSMMLEIASSPMTSHLADGLDIEFALRMKSIRKSIDKTEKLFRGSKQ